MKPGIKRISSQRTHSARVKTTEGRGNANRSDEEEEERGPFVGCHGDSTDLLTEVYSRFLNS